MHSQAFVERERRFFFSSGNASRDMNIRGREYTHKRTFERLFSRQRCAGPQGASSRSEGTREEERRLERERQP